MRSAICLAAVLLLVAVAPTFCLVVSRPVAVAYGDEWVPKSSETCQVRKDKTCSDTHAVVEQACTEISCSFPGLPCPDSEVQVLDNWINTRHEATESETGFDTWNQKNEDCVQERSCDVCDATGQFCQNDFNATWTTTLYGILIQPTGESCTGGVGMGP